MNDTEYQLNELYKKLTGKVCVTMDSDAVESMREAYQSKEMILIDERLEIREETKEKYNDIIDKIQEEVINYVYDTLLSDNAEAMEQPIIDIIDKLRG